MCQDGLDTTDTEHYKHVLWDKDPRFVQPVDGVSFEIDSLSPAIDAGNPDFAEDFEIDYNNQFYSDPAIAPYSNDGFNSNNTQQLESLIDTVAAAIGFCGMVIGKTAVALASASKNASSSSVTAKAGLGGTGGSGVSSKGMFQRFVEGMHSYLSNSVNNGNYMDINFSVGYYIGATCGIIIDNRQNVRFYCGSGLIYGVGLTCTWSPNQVSTGWSIGVQAQSFFNSGQVGYTLGTFSSMSELVNSLSRDNLFWEHGGAISFPGWSLTGIYIFEPID